jgi:acetoacetyl-CoA synthetase
MQNYLYTIILSIDTILNDSAMKLLWSPTEEMSSHSHLFQFMKWLKANEGLSFDGYSALWKWSCEDSEKFWQCVIKYFNLDIEGHFDSVIAGNMPMVKWFNGSRTNYAEHLLRQGRENHNAIVFYNESGLQETLSWNDVKDKVSQFKSYLKDQGVKKGDRVVAYLPNIPEAVIAFIATASLGAIWSSCSPDFGVSSVIDRFSQIEPKVMIVADGYFYNGKHYSRSNEAAEIADHLSTLKAVVMVNYTGSNHALRNQELWEEIMKRYQPKTLVFEKVEFNDPLWILYSSGTTGIPKAITQSHGGILLEHTKYMAFHNDVHQGEVFFWYTTTGWMMWNYLVGSMLMGACLVLYDGSPGYKDMTTLWSMASTLGIHHFGTSAPYLLACMKKNIDVKGLDLSELRSIGSTGAPLPSEGFDYVYEHIKEEVWLCSMAGGTDVCTAFVGGNPLKPVVSGEIQCIALGVDLHAYNEDGIPVINELGEMVIRKPMPSMPIYFWNDENYKRYTSSYFEMYPGEWRHGDWIKITDRGSLVIYGRSDATLNRHGIRIGTSEIYSSLAKIQEIEESIIINLELDGGEHYMPLFVKMAEGKKLNIEIINRIKNQLKSDYTPRHVPDVVIEVPDIPFTISGKKLETPVKKILLGMSPGNVANREAMRNPGALDYFIENKEFLLDKSNFTY